MSTTEAIVLIALMVYAVYKQTRITEVTGQARFKLAIIYAVVGLIVGLSVPHTAPAVGLAFASFVLSVVIGVARGAHTRIWRTADGRVMSRGTLVTISLFLALIASKFVLGTVAYFLGIHDSSMGEILVMIAVSVAVQAEIVWRRARELGAGASQVGVAATGGGR